jgi:dolichyl-phosphate-mannose-protein mannosyltransferase
MGIGSFMKNKYNIGFIVFIILFMFLLNYRLDTVLGWDESRHAVQGHIVYDWIKTAADGDGMSYKDFVSAYGEKGISPGAGYNIGWYAYFDPPVHAIGQAIVYMIFGDSVWSARFATQLFILFLSPLMYLLASRILKSKKLGLLATMLFLTSYITYFFGRLSFLAVPLSLCMVGWYYYLFYRKSKRYVIRISKSFRITLQWSVVVSALFLTAATLMKYHSVIYAGIFMAVYIIVITIKDMSKRKITHISDLYTSIKESGGWQLGWQFFFQLIILLAISARWFYVSLYEMKMGARILFEGSGRTREWTIKFFTDFAIQILQKTRVILPMDGINPGYHFKYMIGSISLFALVPIGIWFARKKDSFVSKNPRLMTFIIVVFLTATFLISNRQLRYMIHGMPFLFILITKGIDDVSNFLNTKLKFRYAFLFLAIVLIGLSVNTDMKIADNMNQMYGIYTPELAKYMDNIPDPKLLLDIKADVEPLTTGYYYSPDLFIFETMIVNKEFNPRRMQQLSSFIDWKGIAGNYEEVLPQIAAYDDQINTVIITFKFDALREKRVEQVREVLKKEGYSETELEWYYVFEKD